MSNNKESSTNDKSDKLLLREESYKVQGAIIKVHRTLGSGFLEAVYQEALEVELKRQDIPFVSQPEMQIEYNGHLLSHTYKPDLICFNKIIVELKAVQELLPTHSAQVINYLKVSNMQLGLLVNFNAHPKVIIKRLVRL